MKFRISRQERVVGAFVIGAVLMVVVLLIFMGANQRWFAKDYEFYSIFDSGSGLKRSMPVTLKGFEIGAVDRLLLNDDNTVTLEFHVYDTYYDRITRNSVLQLVSNPFGLGGGLVLHPGSTARAGGAALPPLDTNYIPSLASEDGKRLVSMGLVVIPESEDVVSRLLGNVEVVLGNLDQSLASVNDVVLSLERSLSGEGDGPLTAFFNQAEAFSVALNQGVEDITDRISPIMTDLTATAANLKQASDAISDPTGFAATLLDPKGSLATLLDDGNQLYDRIESTISQIDQSAGKIRDFSNFLSDAAPEVRLLLEEGRTALEQSKNVLESVAKNPLVRPNMPEEEEPTSSFKGYRDEDF